MGGDALIPRFRNIDYQIAKFYSRLRVECVERRSAHGPEHFAAYGDELQQKLDSYYGSGFSMSMMGEVLSRYENHVSIDKNVVDAWDIPVLHVDAKYSDNEFNMSRDAVDIGAALAEAAGFEVLVKNYEPNPPGYSIHELGTCRMGDDSKSSVLNKWNQSHDIKKLFVVDGSSFVGTGWQNPTMTILALAMRSLSIWLSRCNKGTLDDEILAPTSVAGVDCLVGSVTRRHARRCGDLRAKFNTAEDRFIGAKRVRESQQHNDKRFPVASAGRTITRAGTASSI